MNKKPPRSSEILVTQKLLLSVKSELKSDITSVALDVKSLRSEMSSIRSEVDSLRFEMNSRFEKMDSKFETLAAAIHRTNALVEEQNSRNRIVLDGYDQIYRRQEEYEKRIQALEN